MRLQEIGHAEEQSCGRKGKPVSSRGQDGDGVTKGWVDTEVRHFWRRINSGEAAEDKDKVMNAEVSELLSQ